MTLCGTIKRLNSDQNAVVTDFTDRSAGVDTGHTISLGDVFDFSYWWRDAFAWNDAGDQISFTLFTTLDNTIGGARQNEYVALSGTSSANNSYQEASGSFVITNATDVGKNLFVEINGVDGGGGADGFVRLDDVYLEASAKPSNLVFWTGDTNLDWNTASNWFDALPNAVDADVRLSGGAIAGPTAVNISSSVTVNNLQFDGDNQYTVTGSAGQSLTLGGTSPTVTVSSGSHEISADIVGTSGLVKEGNGTLVVSGVNSYSGDTTVNGGSLTPGSLTTLQGTVTVNAGGTLAFADGVSGTFINDIAGDGSVSFTDSDLTNENVALTGSNGSFNGTISVGNFEGTNVSTLRAGVNNAFGSATATVDVDGSFATAELDGVSVSNQWTLSSRSGATNPGAENDPHISTVTGSGASTITGDIDGSGDSNHVIEAASGTTLTIDSTLLDSEDETGTFKFQGAGDINIGVSGVLDSGKIVGDNVNVVKTGTGTLTIATEPSTASTDTSNATGISWGGTTTVQEGRMTILAGTSDSGEPFSDVTVNAGAVYDVSDFGTYNLGVGKSIGGGGTIDANDNGAIKTVGYFDDGFLVPGDSIGTLTVDGNLSLNTFSTIATGAMTFELGSSNSTPGTDNDLVVVTNNLTLFRGAASNTFNLNVIVAEGALSTSGSYTLFDATNLVANGVTGSAFSVSFANEQGTVLETRQTGVVTVSEASDTITLSAGGSAPLALTWSGGLTTWDVDLTPNWNSDSERFFDLDNVTFDDTAANFDVFVGDIVSPGSITFNNSSNDYSFTGQAIEGSATLVKNGTGTATLGNDGNSFTGGIEVNAGTLVLDGDNTAISGGITVNAGGTLDIGVAANDTDKNLVADNGAHGPIEINSGGTIRVFDSEVLDQITGAGDLSFEGEASDLGNNTGYSGNITIKDGAEVEILNANSLGDATGSTTVQAGGRLFIDDSVQSDVMSNEPLSLAGFGAGGNEGALQVGGASEHTFGGAITLTGDTRLRVANASGIMNVTGSVTGANAGLAFNPVGTINISGPVSLGNGGITKDSSGTVNLSNTVAYSGDTNVNAGTLALSGAASLGTSANINVASSATLDISAIGPVTLSGQNLTVDGDLIGDVNATNSSAVAVNSNNSFQGNLSATDSTVSGLGTVTGNLTANSGATVSPGGNVNVDVLVSEDASMRSGDPTVTYNSARMGIGLTNNNGLGRGLVKFDLSSANIPAGGIVQGADLVFRVGFAWGPAVSQDVNIQVHEVTTDWEEFGNSGTADGTGGVTWNLAVDPVNATNAETGEVAWSTPGGDFSGTVLGLSDTLDPAAVGGGTQIVISGANLDSYVINNLNETALDFLLKLSNASEGVAADQFNAIWLDTNSTGSQPGIIRLDVFDPTQTLTVGGDYAQATGASLAIDIASTTDMDLLDVTGAFSAAGDLDVSLLGGFSPSEGDSFDILNFASASGSFDNINLPALAGDLSWDTSNLLVDGTLAVIAGGVLEGDYDGDGQVGQGDLDVVLLNWGTSNFVLLPGNDPANEAALPYSPDPFDGSVDQNELDGVLLNWGSSLAAASATVPEPSSLVILLVSALSLSCSRRRTSL